MATARYEAPPAGGSAAKWAFTGWAKQAPADPADVAQLYERGRTERQIARELGVSRQRVSEAMASAGIDRREASLPCPLSREELSNLVAGGMNQAQLADRFGVARGTASRWLAECGIGRPDARADAERLRGLYVEQRLTTREVGAELGVSHNRVIRELALAGIPRRSRHERRPRDRRTEVTREALEELYVRRGLSVRELTALLGVSDEYLRKRLRECGFAKRRGTFRPKLSRSRGEIVDDAARLYDEAGMSLRDVAAHLEVSATIVREMLHEAGVTVRPPGRWGSGRSRQLLRDRDGDPEIVEVLRRFAVALQDPDAWSRPGPLEAVAPLPLPDELLEALYVRLGLSAFHIGILCGVGALAVVSGLRATGIELRPPGQPCPWTTCTYG